MYNGCHSFFKKALVIISILNVNVCISLKSCASVSLRCMSQPKTPRPSRYRVSELSVVLETAFTCPSPWYLLHQHV